MVTSDRGGGGGGGGDGADGRHACAPGAVIYNVAKRWK